MHPSRSGEGLSSHRLNLRGVDIAIVELGRFGRWAGLVVENVFRGPVLNLWAEGTGDQCSSV